MGLLAQEYYLSEHALYRVSYTYTYRYLFLFYSHNSHFKINVKIRIVHFRYVNKDRHSVHRIVRIAFFI